MLRKTSVPVVSVKVAMSVPAVLPQLVQETIQLPEDYFEVFAPRRTLTRRNWERFVAIRVPANQALPMAPLLLSNTVAVIDRHYNSFALWNPPRPNMYAIQVGADIVFRYVTFEAGRLILRPRNLDYAVELLELNDDEAPSGPIVGRVCICISEV
uniref:Peptidase S24/S26A/S26B/S26C domain-containing protein n=2 Tax=Paracidobacterium acidisoli TaxID=2303751 RepID=A0A372INR9_9BACT